MLRDLGRKGQVSAGKKSFALATSLTRKQAKMPTPRAQKNMSGKNRKDLVSTRFQQPALAYFLNHESLESLESLEKELVG